MQQKTFDADFVQHVHLFERALPMLEESDAGAAVFIASIASILTQLPPQELAYGTMKAALINYVGQMSVQNASYITGANLRIDGAAVKAANFWGCHKPMGLMTLRAFLSY